VEIRVADTGKGIPAQSLKNVFDKFHQIEQRSTESNAEGTGLGLAICKEIIQHYGGRIWVESEPGEGSCFKFRLPAAKSGRESYAEFLTGIPSDGGDEADPLILAVDDSPGIRDYLEQLFRDDGFRIVTVGDGLTALKAAEEMMPRCIIMDLMMPGMEGSEAIRRLRANPVTENIPVVVLSAYPYRNHAGATFPCPRPWTRCNSAGVPGAYSRRTHQRPQMHPGANPRTGNISFFRRKALNTARELQENLRTFQRHHVLSAGQGPCDLRSSRDR
jgi:CheY-like chemotaxis protein